MKHYLFFLFSIGVVTQVFLSTVSCLSSSGSEKHSFVPVSAMVTLLQAGSTQPGDHPSTIDERAGDAGLGGHNLPVIIIIIAFIYSILSWSNVLERRAISPMPYGLPVGQIIIGGGLAVLTIFFILSSGGGAPADHPQTVDERAGDYFFGCFTHHVMEVWLCAIAALLSLASVVLMFLKTNWVFFAITIFLAAALEFAVAIILLGC
jgi:hypothetical protein